MPCSNFVPFNPALASRKDNICGFLSGVRAGPSLVNATKIPSLRGISRTAPYFHDNSAQTLEEVLDHYVNFFEFHFRRKEGTLDGRLSEQDVQDIIAFMKLL
jgi:cytochrome c peroxidase